MARVSALRGHRTICRLLAHHFLGRAHVSFPARRSDLHLAMVFARRFSLVPVALRGRAIDALRRAGARRDASGRGLVVREQSALSLARRDRAWNRLLHDSESDRPPGLQLSSGGNRFLDLRAFRELDWNATPRRRPVSGLDDHGEHRGFHSNPDPGGDGGIESSHDDAGIFPAPALQSDTALHCVRRDFLHGF